MKLPKTKQNINPPPHYYERQKSFYYYDPGYNMTYGECRESLASELNRPFNPLRAFAVPYGSYLVRGIKTIRSIEKKLKLRKKSKSRFYRTKREGIILVELGRFWGHNSMRQSIFTALLKNKKRYFRNGAARQFLELFEKGYTLEASNYDTHLGFIDNLWNLNSGIRVLSIKRLVRR